MQNHSRSATIGYAPAKLSKDFHARKYGSTADDRRQLDPSLYADIDMFRMQCLVADFQVIGWRGGRSEQRSGQELRPKAWIIRNSGGLESNTESPMRTSRWRIARHVTTHRSREYLGCGNSHSMWGS
jgi:hypothetical protein